MEEPQLVYCEVINSEEVVQPPPPPLPKRRENISASFIKLHNSPRRIPPLRSMTFITNSCERCRQNASSKTQVVLSIAVVIFAIMSAVFMTLYFRSFDGRKSLPNSGLGNACQNYSIVSNCSGSKTKYNNGMREELNVTKECNTPINIVMTPNKTNGTGSKYSIVFPRISTKDYVISHSKPQMTAITVCFWVSTTQTRGTAHYLSYSTFVYSNEFLVYGQTDVRIWRTDSSTPSKSKGNAINDGKWHSICCSWSSQKGEYKIYKDGKLANSGENFKKGHTINGGGTWVLGQDQDGSPGGGFRLNEAMQGEISEVNVWDKELSYEEIQQFSTPPCQRHDQLGAGNLVRSWDDFIAGAKGDVKIVEGPKC